MNVDHLFLGTHQDNMNDKVAKGRQLHGPAVYGAKLGQKQAAAIFLDKRDNQTIAAEYGVSRTAIRLIKAGKNWRRVTQQLQQARLS